MGSGKFFRFSYEKDGKAKGKQKTGEKKREAAKLATDT
jgi:hypothetical protein